MSIKDLSFRYDQSDSTEILADLAATLSHDVRTPLRHMNHFLEFFQKARDSGNEEEAKEYLGIVKDNIDLTSSMLDGVIRYARIGRGLDAPASCDVSVMTIEALRRACLTLDVADVRIRFDGFKEVTGHRDLLEEMFVHLFENSIMFASAGTVPEITVRSELWADKVIIRVSDNGPGIQEGYERVIFDLFQSGVTGKPGQGIGLGLAFCRRITEVHGGKITFATYRDADEDKSCFQITLPVHQSGRVSS